MIKKIKSRLSIKVFLLTALLLITCCSITYLCIARFTPYIYSHDLTDTEEYLRLLQFDLPNVPQDEALYYIQSWAESLSEDMDNEFVCHIFQNSGEELALPDLKTKTGKRIEDYKTKERSANFEVCLNDGIERYTVFISRNTEKQSQVIEALQKVLPVLSAIIFSVSVIMALFYTWYITKPIKEVSKVSEKMAGMDFHSLCPTSRTDEIGVLSRSLNDLSGKLGTALSDLQEANQKLQADIEKEHELERQRIEFFSAASHELKTPITIIKGQLEGMLYQVGRYKDREIYLAQSLEVTNTLEKMVQELLTISRLDRPEYCCKKSDIDFSGLINERLIAYEDLLIQKELTIEKSIPPDFHIWGDMQLLQKVLDNLLGNAITYSGTGNRIIVNLWKEADKVNLTIENTGVHIPDEDIPKLFEAFYRVEQSRNRQTGGTGLGLYIVKTILDLHRAEIKIANSTQGVIVSVQF